ncbi:unnamed protein product [Phytophthora fragariaefolia]|uniref:Unnamed protein product n=1 Tax=Phytophthora fragariaefolia TaxID=1490495 RepID=A0A9W6XNT6_9STRA|nr:unnamed protein product [Phytophthora fragariaefolia]
MACGREVEGAADAVTSENTSPVSTAPDQTNVSADDEAQEVHRRGQQPETAEGLLLLHAPVSAPDAGSSARVTAQHSVLQPLENSGAGSGERLQNEAVRGTVLLNRSTPGNDQIWTYMAASDTYRTEPFNASIYSGYEPQRTHPASFRGEPPSTTGAHYFIFALDNSIEVVDPRLEAPQASNGGEPKRDNTAVKKVRID